MQVITPLSSLEPDGEMFQRVRKSIFSDRPRSEASDLDTEFEDDSEFEEGSEEIGPYSEDNRRRSQTTISSYDEAPTPSSGRGQRPLALQLKPVEGPRGPHLFRTSQSSGNFNFDYALQMSPLLPKHPPPRTDTALSQQTVTPISQHQQDVGNFSIDAIVDRSGFSSNDNTTSIRRWNSTQVIDWMVDSGLDESLIECFELHDITGQILMDLQFDDLKELGIISFGKRHQLWNAISVLQGRDGSISPQQTPFQDISRPCTTNPQRSPSRGRDTCETPIDGEQDGMTMAGGKKRRGRKPNKTLDIITPAESVSIVAIEQLLPKQHTCNKGERCAKWRKQQRQLKQLHDEHGIGRFPISPTKGGRIFVAGDPGNALTADNMLPNIPRPLEESFRPHSVAIPSLVASSDLLGPGQLPDFTLHADVLEQLEKRDPQENVKQFLRFQHLQTPASPQDDLIGNALLTPVQRPSTAPPERNVSPTLPLFPLEHIPSFSSQSHAQPALQPPRETQGPHGYLKNLPKLDIPRSATAGPQLASLRSPQTATSICRSATASPGNVYRLGTPASEMDVPLTAISYTPVARDNSQSVPPNMQFRESQQQQSSRSQSRAQAWRRPSLALEAVKEHEIYSPCSTSNGPRPSMSSHSSSGSSATTKSGLSVDSATANKIRDPGHHSPQTKQFGYGADCSHAGWMRKRHRTKMLRHEWQDAHCRLKGTTLAMHANARLTSTAVDSINVEDYAVACGSVASSSKLSAAFKSLHIKSDKDSAKTADPAPFAFQLVPSKPDANADRKAVSTGKTHHFAVKTKDERIDWMRELMLAKALQQKGKGYEVEVNGVQA